MSWVDQVVVLYQPIQSGHPRYLEEPVGDLSVYYYLTTIKFGDLKPTTNNVSLSMDHVEC